MKADQERSPREYLLLAWVFIRRALRAARWGALAFGIGMAVTAVIVLSAQRTFRSETVLMYDRGVRAGAVVGGAEVDSPRQVALRIQDMMMSRQRLQKAIEDFALYPSIVSQHGYVDAVDEMRKHLKFTARDGYTFHLSYEADSRDQAQKVLASLANGLIDEDSVTRRREAESTKTFLDAEKKQADADLKARESALSVFLTQHPELAAESASAASAGGAIRAADRERFSANPAELAGLEMQASQIEEMITSAAASRPLPSAGASPSEQAATLGRSQAEAALTQARRDLADKRAMYTDEHPDVKSAQRRVVDAEADVRRAIAATSAAVRPAAGGAAAPDEDPNGTSRVASLRRALSAVRMQIGTIRSRSAPKPVPAPKTSQGVVAVDTEWTRLFREVSEARERQSQLESRQFQAGLVATLASSGEAGRLVVIDPAFKPTRPVAGRRATTALLGGAASLILAMLVMLAMAFLDERLYSVADVQRVIGDQFVILVPSLPSSERKNLPPFSGDER
jgi:uncharacterized protein involved in exopolysaccharide biosynthesis